MAETLGQRLRWSRVAEKPRQLHVSLTERCCLPCTMCDIWKRKPGRELAFDEWCGVFDQMAAWAGPVDLNFSGGEPLMRRDFVDLVRHAAGLGFTVTSNTNGVLLTAELARTLEDVGLQEIFISLDGIRAETHDRMRGRKGTFDRATAAIGHLEPLQRIRKILAVVLHRHNIGEIPGLLAMAERKGFYLIIQPLFHPFGKPYQDAWIHDTDLLPREEDLPLLNETLDMLADVRRRGGSVCNQEGQLEALKGYFAAPVTANGLTCNAGHSDISMDPYGNVLLCFWMEPVGNALRTPLPWLWNRPKTMRRRYEIEHCKRTCNVLNCNFERV